MIRHPLHSRPAVTIHVSWAGSVEFYLEYSGPPGELIALGVATVAMTLPAQKGKPRKDSDGRPFRRQKLPSGKIRLCLWRARSEVMSMPGVTAELIAVADAERAEWLKRRQRQETRAATLDANHDHGVGIGFAHGMVTKSLLWDDSIPDAERAAAIREFLDLAHRRAGVLAYLETARECPLNVLLECLRTLPVYREGRPALRVINGGRA